MIEEGILLSAEKLPVSSGGENIYNVYSTTDKHHGDSGSLPQKDFLQKANDCQSHLSGRIEPQLRGTVSHWLHGVNSHGPLIAGLEQK